MIMWMNGPCQCTVWDLIQQTKCPTKHLPLVNVARMLRTDRSTYPLKASNNNKHCALNSQLIIRYVALTNSCRDSNPCKISKSISDIPANPTFNQSPISNKTKGSRKSWLEFKDHIPKFIPLTSYGESFANWKPKTKLWGKRQWQCSKVIVSNTTRTTRLLMFTDQLLYFTNCVQKIIDLMYCLYLFYQNQEDFYFFSLWIFYLIILLYYYL